ncbi:CPBP family intramembrane metalloprotease [Saccharopolyspora rhizosphaerae]|uniref:CPBP family intramembrane metalloprotease n=1 Tax=Saccharopolyspora rhizosphaerae TaxID=2492662 RepID=A0A3R8VET1_9PSEU|nr:type II CAAX endopeptidase family protein [Saccharopolyspora rhizosphaerae]RRO16057.1 CPBP family intramembrane metalloprotease [Saccharopolyspora rhizosphaerae]
MIEHVSTALLDGPGSARRPTGPLLALLVVIVCLLVGPALVTLAWLPLLDRSALPLVDGPVVLEAQLVLLLSFLGASGLLALWVRFKEGRPLASLGFFPASRIGAHLALGAGTAVLLLAIPVAVNLLSGQYRVGPLRAAQVAAVLLALLGFTAQACTEEVVTRGYLLQTAYRQWGLTAAIAFQAVVFALLHGVNFDVGLVALLNILLIGLVLGMWAVAEGSLWGVCAFHVVWNWCQGNVAGIEVSGMDLQATLLSLAPGPGSAELLTGGGFGVEGSLVTTGVLLVAGAAAFRAVQKRRLASTGTA